MKLKREKEKSNKSAVESYFIIVQNEYNIERNKKQSLENRAGIFLTIHGAILVYLLESVRLNNIFGMFLYNINFVILLKITSGIALYVLMTLSLILLLRVITVNEYFNFNFNELEANILESWEKETASIVLQYKEIIEDYRIMNSSKAKMLRWSIRYIIIIFITYVIYINC